MTGTGVGLRGVGVEPGPGMADASSDINAGNAVNAYVAGMAGKASRDGGVSDPLVGRDGS